MKKRALLIGSPTGGLTGVENDVAGMHAWLVNVGFETRICQNTAATRLGILNAFKSLIGETYPGDAALVYFSGDGGLVRNTSPGKPGSNRTLRGGGEVAYYQFIAPVDIDVSTPGDFRGILDLELSLLLEELTERTLNVCLIFDCCHSARIARGANADAPKSSHFTPRSRTHLWEDDITALRAGLRPRKYAEGNPRAVRLLAAGARQRAYEYTNAKGERRGVFTESLLLALEEARGNRVSWDTIFKRVRELVRSQIPSQKPECEGPGRRYLFETVQSETGPGLVVFQDGLRLTLGGGHLYEIQAGDEYAIMPPGIESYEPGQTLARAKVTRVFPACARLELLEPDSSSSGAISPGARAFPLNSSFPGLKIAFEIDSNPGTGEKKEQGAEPEISRRFQNELLERIQKSLYLELIKTSGPEQAQILIRYYPQRAKLEVLEEGIRIISHSGFPGESIIDSVLRHLEDYARGLALRRRGKQKDAGRSFLYRELAWGRFPEKDGDKSLSFESEIIQPGEKIYLRVKNTGEKILYVSVFAVGVWGAITLLSTAEPSGVEITPGARYYPGSYEGREFQGLELIWPESDPYIQLLTEGGPRPDSFVFIFSDTPLDLRDLETYKPTENNKKRITRGALDFFGKAHSLKFETELITFLLAPPT